jgi:hypothetical protein
VRWWRRYWMAVAALLGLAVWGLTDIRWRGQFRPDAPELHRTDFTVYTNAADVLLSGGDPYAVPGPRGWYYLYPPLFALLVSPLRHLDSQWQVVIWFAISVGLAYGCLSEGRRIGLWLWKRCAELPSAQVMQPPAWVGIVAFVTVLLPLLECLQRGQVGVLILLSLMLGLRLTLTRESALQVAGGGVLLALPAAIKITPALPVLLYAVLLGTTGPRWRGAAAWGGLVAGTALFWVGIPGAVVGWDENLRLLARWRDTVAANEMLVSDRGINPLSWSNQSLEVALFRLGEIAQHGFPPPLRAEQVGSAGVRLTPFPPRSAADWQTPISAGRIGLLVLLLAAAVRLWRAADLSGLAAAFGLGCAASLLISPISWGHHFVLLFPAGLLVPAWCLLRGRRRLAKLSAGTLAALVLIHYICMPVAGPWSVLGLGLTVWFVIVCVALIWAARRGGDTHSTDTTQLASTA